MASDKKPTGLKRSEVYRGEVVEGRPVSESGTRRLFQSIRNLPVSSGERQEADLDSLPLDERLQVMLDSGTYDLENLSRPTRSAVKLLGLSVAEQLA